MRRQARDLVFKLIFESQNDDNFDYSFCLNNLLEEITLDGEDLKFIEEIFVLYTENKQNILDKLKDIVTGYDLDRIYKVDIALLSLAISEIEFYKTPAPIVINEVVGMAKKYSTEKSFSFINGILAKFYSV